MTLRELRESKSLSQREVARRLNLTQPAVYKIENGNTTTSTLKRYAEAIGASWIEVCQAIDAARPCVTADN